MAIHPERVGWQLPRWRAWLPARFVLIGRNNVR